MYIRKKFKKIKKLTSNSQAWVPKGTNKSLQKDYDITDDGPLNDYLGTRFERKQHGSVELTQPRMIKRVLDIVSLNQPDVHVKNMMHLQLLYYKNLTTTNIGI